MSSITSEEETFDWNKYLMLRNAEEVPESFFFHICKSEMNGIELGSIIEVENEDHSGYWFASVCSSTGVLIRLHYLGDENDNHDFWLEVKSPRIHPLNWGSKNNKTQSPPHPDRFSRVNLKVIQEKVKNCEYIVSNAVLQMKGAPIYNIFKPEMFVEIQDIDYPYRVWISKVIKNVGGRLLLQTQGTLRSNEPFWLFYLNKRVFPLGWADQKGLPWRLMNSNNDIKNNNNNSSLLLNVLKPKTPVRHSYKVGEMLEVLNPYSLMVFYVATIVRTYDNRYFKVEVDNEYDLEKRLTFWATKENPYLFNAGWASKHKFLLKPPSDWNKPYTFSWSEYISMKDSKLAFVDNGPTKKNDDVRVGMKLEAVDPIEPDRIRVATVKGFADHWMFLTFDRTNWRQELLHVRSIYSDDVFPVGWCNKHKYQLSVPKLPYTDCNDFDHCYYVSDVDNEFNKSDNVAKYSQYFKGEIPYHYSEKAHKTFDDDLEESLQNLLNDDNVQRSNVSSEVSNEVQEVVEPNVEVKLEPPELDEEFHDALFSEEVDGIKEFEDNVITKFDVDDSETEFKEDNVIIKKENISVNPINTFNTHIYRMCIYYNKDCYTGSNLLKKRISMLPENIGPGPVSRILHEALTVFVSLDYSPCNALKKIKKIQHLLFNGPGGVEMLVSTVDSKTSNNYSEFLILPESKMMAKTYCSALCNLSGMCENFMTTEKTTCPRRCSEKYIPKLKFELERPKSTRKATKRKANSDIFTKFNKSTKKESLHESISKIAKEKLDWSNKTLVDRYNYYLACILNYETHMKKLRENFTEIEFAIIREIQSKKWNLKKLNEIGVLDCTKTEIYNENKFCFAKNWKHSFQNYYNKHPKYKKFKIDIGHIENIQVTSNPIHWNPLTVYKYLSNDPNCKQVGKKLFSQQVDGVAFMLLKEQNLMCHLGCDVSLMARIMCHIAQVKYTFLTLYNTPDPSLQYNSDELLAPVR